MNERDRAIYWQFACLHLEQGCRRQEIAAAQTYFLAHINPEEESDAAITRQLYQIWQTEPGDRTPSGAELCLRCYISHHIEQTCGQFAERFGRTHGFGRRELLPLVLTDVSLAESLQPLVAQPGARGYIPLAAEILRTYDPERGSLGSWASRLVRQQRDFLDFLRDRGIYLISDWALLNDTQPHRLSKLLALPAAELERYQVLLSSYHAVYRRDRLQAGPGSRCQPPRPEQLERIIAQVQQQSPRRLTPKQASEELQTLAGLLRHHRLQQRTKTPLTESLDEYQSLEGAIAVQTNDADIWQRDFLHRYHDLVVVCLEQAIQRALQERLQRQPERAAAFLEALERFHVRGETMTEIAACIGLQAQYQVSRLLKLKQLRETVSRYTLELLSEQVAELAKAYAEAQSLKASYQAMQAVIAAELEEVMQEAASEVEVKQRSAAPRSLFARSLCTCLQALRAEGD